MKKAIIKTIFALKILFIPCKENDYKSKFLDGRLLFSCVMVLIILKLLILPVLSFFGQSIFYASISKESLIALVNEERSKNSLAPLTENKILDKTAEMKAQNMMDAGYFSHNSPTGITPWYWFKKAGYDYKTAGENLAIGFIETSEVFNAWKESPSHKANLLNPKFKEVGIAVLKGNFQGKETFLVVQTFGTLKATTAVQKEPVSSPAPKKVSTPNPTTKPAAQSPTQTPATQSPVLTPTPVLTPAPTAIVEKKTEETPKQTVQKATPTSKPEGVVAGAEEEISSSKANKAAEESFAFRFWKFMVDNYYDLIQRIIFYALIFIIVALLLNIFIKISVQNPALIFKTVFFVALLAGFFLLDKQSILQIIPHDLDIF